MPCKKIELLFAKLMLHLFVAISMTKIVEILKNIDETYDSRCNEGMFIFDKIKIIKKSFMKKLANVLVSLDIDTAISAIIELNNIREEFVLNWNKICELPQLQISLLGKQLDIIQSWTEIIDFSASKLRRGFILYKKYKNPYFKFESLLLCAQEKNFFDLEDMSDAYHSCLNIYRQLSKLTDIEDFMKPQLDDLSVKLNFMFKKIKSFQMMQVCKCEINDSDERSIFRPQKKKNKIIDLCTMAWGPANDFDDLIDSTGEVHYKCTVQTLEKYFKLFQLMFTGVKTAARCKITLDIIEGNHIQELSERSDYMRIRIQEKKTPRDPELTW